MSTSNVPLRDTDEPIARAIAEPAPTHDHMGRPVTESKMAAFRHDLPYMLGMAGLLVFLVGALAGWWGR